MARSPCAHARNGTPDKSGSHDRHIQRETYKLEGELAACPEGRVCSNLAKIAHGRGDVSLEEAFLRITAEEKASA